MPELPPAIEQLVAKMLSKDPAARPANASMLKSFADVAAAAPLAERAPRLPRLTNAERRLVAVILTGDGEDSQLVLREAAGSAADLALQSAREAARSAAEHPSRRIALVIGQHTTGPASPSREAFDRAAALLARATPGSIILDEMAAALLETRFALHRRKDCWFLGKELDVQLASRLLLGRP